MKKIATFFPLLVFAAIITYATTLPNQDKSLPEAQTIPVSIASVDPPVTDSDTHTLNYTAANLTDYEGGYNNHSNWGFVGLLGLLGLLGLKKKNDSV